MNLGTVSSGVVESRVSTRFDRRLARILDHATAIFCEKGYERASMRDLSRACGMSLAGLYYYFESKQRLLYLVERESFERVMDLLSERLNGVADPEARVRVFIQNHVEFFLARPKVMKVLSHEDDVLEGELGTEIAAIKRSYYRACADLVECLKLDRNQRFNSRNAVMALFGMINWLYTWYNPTVDGSPAVLAQDFADIFLRGVYSGT
ncbi:MAG: TetR family transcriptional regulator [Acidobacteria bacterium]|nr:TetR family transcriptional regulator [Acidobacteriota bacterium]